MLNRSFLFEKVSNLLLVINFVSCALSNDQLGMLNKVKFKQSSNGKNREYNIQKEGFGIYLAAKVFNCDYEDRNNWMAKVIYGKPQPAVSLVNVVSAYNLELTTPQIKLMDFKVNFTLKQTCQKCINANCVPKDKPCDYCPSCNTSNSCLTDGIIINNVEIILPKGKNFEMMKKEFQDLDDIIYKEKKLKEAQFLKDLENSDSGLSNEIKQQIGKSWNKKGYNDLQSLYGLLGLKEPNIDPEKLAELSVEFIKKELKSQEKPAENKTYSPENSVMTESLLSGIMDGIFKYTTPEQREQLGFSSQDVKNTVQEFVENALDVEKKLNEILSFGQNSSVNDDLKINTNYEKENGFQLCNFADLEKEILDNASDTFEDKALETEICNESFSESSDSEYDRVDECPSIENFTNPSNLAVSKVEPNSVNIYLEKNKYATTVEENKFREKEIFEYNERRKRKPTDYEILNLKETLTPFQVPYMPAPLYLFDDENFENRYKNFYTDFLPNQKMKQQIELMIRKNLDPLNRIKHLVGYIKILNADKKGELDNSTDEYRKVKINNLIKIVNDLKQKFEKEKNKILNCDYDHRYNYSSEDLKYFFSSILMLNENFSTVIWINVLNSQLKSDAKLILKLLNEDFSLLTEEYLENIFFENENILRLIQQIAKINYNIKKSLRQNYIADILLKSIILDIPKYFNDVFMDSDFKDVKKKFLLLKKVITNFTRNSLLKPMLDFGELEEPEYYIDKESLFEFLMNCRSCKIAI